MSFVRQPNAEPIPGYHLIEPLGSGGFGEAWKCEAPGGIFKAIKFVFGNLNSMDMDGARAEQEFKALNRVKEVRHPFVLQMDRIEIKDGELAIVMELADRSLHDAYEECKSAGLVGIPRDTLLRYLRDAAEALDHMNEKHGLQHLDIKPRNLFLVSDRVKVADFGLVKHLERSGASGVMGAVTPLYAPPETFTGAISDRSDQYSLGIVYQELLTGHRPFNGKNARMLASQHMNEPPDLRALPESDRSIVARTLEKDPARRFPNCLSFIRALYSARPPSYTTIEVNDGSPQGTSLRPKTMLDTLENFQLEGIHSDDPLVPVDLGIAGELGQVNEAVSNLGVTVAQPSTGALRPTLIIGVGGYGRRALMELRCRFIDRFGDLNKLPMIRFLYLDTDAESVKVAQRGATEVALHQHEVYPLPLQPVIRYRSRQIDQLAEWLPREKLYAIPRNLKTQGSRALGRLAYADHYQRLLGRIKRELQGACDPDAIFSTVSQTGLALRDNVPRIYVIGCATGGGSGFLADLGYAVRRLVKQGNSADSPVINFLFCGAPEDPATPASELANLHATLTELNHFSDPGIPFSAQYGVDGPRMVEEGAAFDQVYLIPQQHRTPEARRDALAHLGSYLFHELTTPLGLRLDQCRMKRNPGAPFRSLGTFGVWFPRGLMLRVDAREACLQMIEGWLAGAGEALSDEEQAMVESTLAGVLTDPELRPDALACRIQELACGHMDGPPKEALTRLLLSIEEQAQQPIAQDDPGGWARQTLTRVRDWLGSGVSMPGVNMVQHRRSQMTRALESAAADLASKWLERFTEVVDSLMASPGRRLAIGEACVSRLAAFCADALQKGQTQLDNRSARSSQGQEQLDQALQNCITGAGGWSLFGSKSRRLLRSFLDHLAVFSRQCLADDTSIAVLQFYAALRGKLNDQMKDLGFCRQRLHGLQELLGMPSDGSELDAESVSDTVTFSRTPSGTSFPAQGNWNNAGSAASQHTPLLSTDTYWESIREASTNRVVLPDGETDLEAAARRFLVTLTPENWVHLDQALGDQVLAARGGLLKLCLDNGDLPRYFATPLLNEAINRLSDLLPITDVAQVEFSAGDGLVDRLTSYHGLAAPVLARQEQSEGLPLPHRRAGMGSGMRRAVLVGSAGYGSASGEDLRPGQGQRKPNVSNEQTSFLLIPASDAGKAFGEESRQALPEVQLVNVPGQAELMFCREQGGLRIADLERMLMICRNAYYELSLVPQTSPHARFDITDWMPLDP